MESRNNPICKDFANEVWLYLDQDLVPTRMDYWNRHIQHCEICSSLIDSISNAESSVKEELFVELSDPSFEKMIVNVFTNKKPKILNLPILSNSTRHITPSKIRFALASAFIIVAFIISFNTTKHNTVKSFRTNVEEKIYPSNNIKLSQMVEMVYGNEIDKQLNSLESQINKLTIR